MKTFLKKTDVPEVVFLFLLTLYVATFTPWNGTTLIKYVTALWIMAFGSLIYGGLGAGVADMVRTICRLPNQKHNLVETITIAGIVMIAVFGTVTFVERQYENFLFSEYVAGWVLTLLPALLTSSLLLVEGYLPWFKKVPAIYGSVIVAMLILQEYLL